MVERRRLCKEGSLKDTQHYSIDLRGSGLTYTCGDSLGVFPENCPELVNALLQRLGFSGEEPVMLPKAEAPVSIREAFSRNLSLAGPTKKVLEAVRAKATESGEIARLDNLLDPAHAEELKEYLANREFIDLAEEFPSARFAAQEYVDLMRKLMPRLYSIASSPMLYPEEIHLTVAVVRYDTNGKPRKGVASTFLADRVNLNEPTVPVFVANSHFGLPEDDNVPMIMVGPGTGIAPFRAFVQDRIARGAQGPMWVFFGDQRREYDYLYGDEWDRYLAEGKIQKLDLAFSRDQAHKIYVQDKMRESAAELWQWLQKGAYFYVCGDAKRMAKDVDAALHDIAREQGGLSEEDAAAYIKLLKKEKRYQRDVY